MTWREYGDVIGVILMVAITVILAAVIGTFVLGLESNIESGNTLANVSVVEVGDGVRRVVDVEAGVVCWQSGKVGGMHCLPLNETSLGGGSR